MKILNAKPSKAVQYFSDEALVRGQELSPQQIIEFIENFRILHSQAQQKPQSILISIKIPEDLLQAFKLKAQLKGKRYQTWIKELMKQEV